jgi:hypothetical protein
LTEESKNLTEVTRQEMALREGTRHTAVPNIGKIIEYAFWMKKEGYAENTTSRRIKILTTLSKRGTDLLDPESVKENIAKQENWNLKTKALAVDAYSSFLKMLGGKWTPQNTHP